MKDKPADLLVIISQKWVAYGACRDKARATAIKKSAETVTKLLSEQLKRILTDEQANALLYAWTNGREGNGDHSLTVSQAKAITAKLRFLSTKVAVR